MKTIANAAFTALAALALTACGGSDKASEDATATDVAMPAEEAMGAVEEGAAPVADEATAPADATGDAVEAATADAEAKM